MKHIRSLEVLLLVMASCAVRTIAIAQAGPPAGADSSTPSIITDRPMPKLSGSTDLVTDAATAKIWCTPSPNNFLDNEVRWFKSRQHSSATGWLKVHLTMTSASSQSGWKIVIRDKAGEEVDDLTASDFLITRSQGSGSAAANAQDDASQLEAITQRIPGNVFRVELRAAALPEKLNICVQSYEFESEASKIAVKEVTHKKDLRIFVKKTDPNYELGRSVAAVYFPSRETKKEISCTGFAVSDTLFVTNYHCLSETWQLRTAFVRYNYEVLSEDDEFKMRFSGFAMPPNSILDFALLRLGSALPVKYIAKLQSESLVLNMPLILFQHPDGSKKRVAESGCAVESVDSAGQTTSLTDFYHSCDSSGGSSGSPVVDINTGVVVGVHHVGTYNPDSANYHNLALKIQRLIDSLPPDILQEVQKYSQVSTTDHH